MLATTFLTWWRRRWRGETPTEHLPEPATPDQADRIELQRVVREAILTLPHQQRAVVMLRFHADLTEAATAEVLGLSVGTVKSYTARALRSMRGLLREEVES